MNRNLKFVVLLLTTMLLASCSIPRIFQVVISQGNLVDQEMLDKLEIGMTKDQVNFVMGQPSFENFFEKNVWNYIYKITTGDEVDVEKKVKLIFDNQNLLSEVVVIKI